MTISTQLFSGILAATDTVAIAAVAAGQVIKVNSITLSQPAGASTATVSIALNGTSLTAANVRLIQLMTGGVPQNVILFPGLILPAAATLNISCTTGAQTNCTINGTRDVG